MIDYAIHALLLCARGNAKKRSIKPLREKKINVPPVIDRAFPLNRIEKRFAHHSQCHSSRSQFRGSLCPRQIIDYVSANVEISSYYYISNIKLVITCNDVNISSCYNQLRYISFIKALLQYVIFIYTLKSIFYPLTIKFTKNYIKNLIIIVFLTGTFLKLDLQFTSCTSQI